MIERVSLPGKEVVLVGTAHVSSESVEDVEQVLDEEGPDVVCVELDPQREEALRDRSGWRGMDIPTALKERKGGMLLLNVILSIEQRRMGDAFDVTPGREMLHAMDLAAERGIQTELIDRDIQETVQDALNSLTLLEKARLLYGMFGAFFKDEEVTAEDVEAMKEQGVIEELVAEMGTDFPALKEAFLTRRDRHMAARIRDTNADKVMAVVGAAHVQGIAEHLRSDHIPAVQPIPPKRFSVMTALTYGVPAVILGMFAAILLTQGAAVFRQAFTVWFLLNAGGAALGAIISRAHPVTVGVAFLAAPFTSINPALPAGLVAAYVEARLDPPTVGDLEAVGEAASFRAFWDNGALQLLLIFFLVNLGSALATYGGGGYLASLLNA